MDITIQGKAIFLFCSSREKLFLPAHGWGEGGIRRTFTVPPNLNHSVIEQTKIPTEVLVGGTMCVQPRSAAPRCVRQYGHKRAQTPDTFDTCA